MSAFTIDAQDFDFYTKIAVPAPTFCPECRAQRRMTWRNERSLYRRRCALTGKDVISCFGPESGITVYDRDVWWSDQWDPLASGAPYDFNEPFFVQFRKLLEQTPMPAVFNNRTVRSNYTNHTGDMKDCYLVFASWGGENILYAGKEMRCKDSADLLTTKDSELCYECIAVEKAYRTLFSENCESCTDSYFLYECRGCSNCFGCVNLRSKSYHIFNEPYSKENYFAALERMDLGNHESLIQAKRKFEELKTRSVRKYANILNCQSVTGDMLYRVDTCTECYDLAEDVRNCKFINNGGMKLYDTYDSYGAGAGAELLHESVDSGANGSLLCFGIVVWGGRDVFYSYNCENCTSIFGCIGLRNKSYCILNKQYTKESFDELRTKIIEHMQAMPYTDRQGRAYRYGEFFPSELSPFAYNETIAQEYYPLTREQADERGFRWRDPESRNYTVTQASGTLPNYIKDVPDSILDDVIGCAHTGTCDEQCTTAFKIIAPELQFYRKLNLPLPRLCPNCRHYQRLKQRNPTRLWHRACQCAGSTSSPQAGGASDGGAYRNTGEHVHGAAHCPNEFETPYAPERPEVIYCEQCYNAEVV